MLLSIVVPVYNVEKYLSRCLDSLINQDINPDEYEIILINDGSTDSSLTIAQHYSENYKQINVINQENRGQSVARNIGMKKSLGTYIYFIDSDDYVQPNTFKGLLNIAIINDLDFIGFGLKRTSDSNYNSEINSEDILKISETTKIYNGTSFISNFNYNNGPWWYFFKNDLIKDLNLTFEIGRMAEDGIFTTQLILNCERIAYYDIDIYRYFINLNSTTTKKNKSHLIKLNDDFQFAIKKFKELIELAKTKKADDKAMQRLMARQESYVFFLFIRLIKANISFNEFKKVIKDLKQINVYPISNFIGKDYNSKKEKILTKIFNNQVLIFILLKLNKILKLI